MDHHQGTPARAPMTLAARDPNRARSLLQGLKPLDWSPPAPQPVLPTATATAPIASLPMPPKRHRAGCRKNSIFFMVENFEWRVLGKKPRLKLWNIANSMELMTKEKGRQSGCLGASGLRILHTLLYGFLNDTTGRCDPSYDAIQTRTGYCRQTISSALDRIEAAGLFVRTRRMVRARQAILCPLTGRVIEITVLRQISNAYVFADPDCLIVPTPRAPRMTFAKRFPVSDGPNIFGAALAGVFDKFSNSPSLPGRAELIQPAKHALATRFEVRNARAVRTK